MYSVTHSTDPWLLARLMTDLQMEGFKAQLPWCEIYNPFDKTFIRFMMTGEDNLNIISFNSHNGVANPTRFTLTESNYLEVLESIVNGKNK